MTRHTGDVVFGTDGTRAVRWNGEPDDTFVAVLFGAGPFKSKAGGPRSGVLQQPPANDAEVPGAPLR